MTRCYVSVLLTLSMLSGVLLLPHSTYAASLEVAGWVPYWNDAKGVADVEKHHQIAVVFPFIYGIKDDGTLKDLSVLSDSAWEAFRKTAGERHQKVIPTVMSSDGDAVGALLGDVHTRVQHIDALRALVEKNNFDGIDIDYENRHAEAKDSFSLFLKELKKKLGKKILSCTLEPRTPPDSLYTVIPNPLRYSNDYREIAKYCDRVQIMAYDQQRADLTLNESKAGQPYFPVSDAEWVRKVVALALKDIPREKLVLGIPTYGYHYAVTTAPNWYKNYARIGALNVPDILDLAHEFKVKPARNRAGEMGFTYLPKGSKVKFPKNLKIPKDTTTGMKVAAQALAYANTTGKEVVFRFVSYSDAEAMIQKIALAKEFGLKGVALFKIDGEEDANVWKYLR